MRQQPCAPTEARWRRASADPHEPGGLAGLKHHADVVVGGGVDGHEPLHHAQGQALTRDRVLVQRCQRPAGSRRAARAAPASTRRPAGSWTEPRASTMRSDRVSDGSSRMATASTWESMAEASTSRAATMRIDSSWKPASMTLAEEAARLADLDEVVARDAVAGLRVRLVVGPGAAAQVEERAEGAIAVDDDVGVVDGLVAVAPALEHRRGDRNGRRDALTLELDVGQAADEADLVLVLRAALVVGLDDEFGLDRPGGARPPRRSPGTRAACSGRGRCQSAVGPWPEPTTRRRPRGLSERLPASLPPRIPPLSRTCDFRRAGSRSAPDRADLDRLHQRFTLSS